jgi:hypothetical protein
MLDEVRSKPMLGFVGCKLDISLNLGLLRCLKCRSGHVVMNNEDMKLIHAR